MHFSRTATEISAETMAIVNLMLASAVAVVAFWGFKVFKDGPESTADKIFLMAALPFMFFTALTPISFTFMLITPVLLYKIKINWTVLWARMKMPGCGKGIILTSAAPMVVMTVMSALFGGMSSSEVSVIVLALIMWRLSLKVAKLISLASSSAKLALPIFMFIMTGGLVTIARVFNFITGHIEDITDDFWAELE